ncbi:unnamed protein product [Caenorhabditis sp. 36 PRJEB53466]|nr:unnamed protein product [Caenorhabditis sp. 36 PRJEB53466]
MDFLHVLKARKKYLRFPSTVYEQLESKHYFMPVGETDDHDSWVTARFSPHRSQEHILYMGDDPGNIGVFDVRKFHDRSVPVEERQLHFFAAHDGAIMDVVGVPHKESQIVSISGDSTVRCWDLNQSAADRSSHMFYGHDGSVRSICFAPDDPNVFVTGARDGQVKIWDMRISPIRKNEEECRIANITYKTAHPSQQSEKPATPKSRGKVVMKSMGASVTSVLFLDEHHIATASSCTQSGIRVWDIRKPTRNGEGQPARILNVPTTSKKKAFGVTCLSVDRFGNRLFASCTNSTIFEYSVPSATLTPINTYTGATIRDFYTQIACSPVSDAIACGSEDQRALIWDLQDQYTYMNDLSTADEIDRRRTQLPKWSCGGHLRKVLNVGWSAQGRYFMSFDEVGVRLWAEPRERKPWQCCDHDKPSETTERDLGLAFEPIRLFEMAETDSAMSCIDSISISPRQRGDSGVFGSPQKVRGPKRPIVESPFKMISSSPKALRLNRSPMAKMSKLSSSPSSSSHLPLQPTNLNAVNPQCAGLLDYTPRHRSKKRQNPFYYEHPTENLPNFVYDTFIKNMLGKSKEEEGSTQKSLSKTSQKRIEDWWQQKTAENLNTAARRRLPSVSEFGESACSKVMSETERIALTSPRKLVLKIASTASTTPVSHPKPMPQTPRKPAGHRRSSRNLMHWLNSTKTDA